MGFLSLMAACAIGGAVGIAALDGCSSSTDAGSSSYSPITSIIVRAESARGGKSCGEGSDEVFKYAAVLRKPDGSVVSGALYDCFTDAAFRDPPFEVPVDYLQAGPTFKIDVFAFNKETVVATGEAALRDAARVGSSLLGAATVTCLAAPRAEVEVVAVCTASSSEGGVSVDGGVGADADAALPKDAGDATTDADIDAAADAAVDAP